MSTRKHFIAVAATVSAIADKNERQKQAEFQAQIFAADNPRFDKGRFLSACGL
jgi:hypothetical protein